MLRRATELGNVCGSPQRLRRGECRGLWGAIFRSPTAGESPRGPGTPKRYALWGCLPLQAAFWLTCACDVEPTGRLDFSESAQEIRALHPQTCRQLPKPTRRGEGTVAARVGEFCLDPLIEPRRFGGPVYESVFDGCTELIASRCDALAKFELRGLSALSYRAPVSGAAVDVLVMDFDSVDASYAWHHVASQQFSNDRFHSTSSGANQQGASHAFLVGRQLVRLLYTDERDGSQDKSDTAARILAEFSRNWTEQSSEWARPPAALRYLPVTDQVPDSVSLALRDALGVEGVGNAAKARYARAGKSWRALAIVHPTVEAAQVALLKIRRSRAARKLRWAPHGAFRYKEARPEGELPAKWVIGRAANVIYGVGDDPLALSGHRSTREEAPSRITLSQKLRLFGQNVTEGKQKQLRKNP